MDQGQNDGDSAQSLTVDSAASVLNDLLSDESEDQQTDETPNDETPVAPSNTEDDEGDAPESEEESPSDEEDAEPSDEDDEAESDDKPQQPQKFRVKVNGEEHEVPLDELVKGYSREADYTRKAQKLADERRQFETAEQTAMRAERQQIATRLAEVEDAYKALVTEPDWDTLRMESPDSFADSWAAWKAHKTNLDRIAEQRRNAEAEVQKDFDQQEGARVRSEREKLHAAIPSWADQETAKAEKGAILEYGKQLGFSEDDIKGVTDHRALVALRKAMLFDRAEADKAKAKKDAVSKIEKVRVAAPGAKSAKLKGTDATRAKQRHAKVGSVDSAAAALTLMLDD